MTNLSKVEIQLLADLDMELCDQCGAPCVVDEMYEAHLIGCTGKCECVKRVGHQPLVCPKCEARISLGYPTDHNGNPIAYMNDNDDWQLQEMLNWERMQ